MTTPYERAADLARELEDHDRFMECSVGQWGREIRFSTEGVDLIAKVIAEAIKAASEPVMPNIPGLDLRDIKGQESAKRAIEIAVAGGHNILLIGPAGCGKTLLLRAACTLARGSLKHVIPLDDIDRERDGARMARLATDAGSFVVATATEAPLSLLDRFAIVITLYPVSAADMLLPPPGEDSATVSGRVAKSRAAAAPANPNIDAVRLLREAAESLSMTARGYDNAIAVAATIARLDGAAQIGRIHVAEAVVYQQRKDA